MSDSYANGHLLPPLKGAELDEAVAEAAENLRHCLDADETEQFEEKAPRRFSATRLVRGAARIRLIRLARKGRYSHWMLHYYGGIPHDVSDSVKRAVRRGYAHLLVVTATRNGVHSATSLHKFGRAVDLGNILKHVGPTAEGRRRLVHHQRIEFEEWRRGDRPHLQELIGPDNRMIVLRGRWAPLPEGNPLENQHDNHVHEGFWV